MATVRLRLVAGVADPTAALVGHEVFQTSIVSE
jgi:hypothetical protein